MMNYYAIKCGILIDGTGAEIQESVWIIIKNKYIVRVEKDLRKIPCDIPIIDATECTVIPGLIDAHKHVMNCGGSGIGVGLNYSQVKKNIVHIAQGGVTSVLDLGSANFAPFLQRINRANTKIFNAISIVTCQGGYPQEYMPRKFYSMGAVLECSTLKEIKNTVKKLHKRGVSVIKTALVSRTFDNKPQKNWTDSQLQCLTDEAHGYGLNVCAHITYVHDYAQAVRCGIDSIHHAAFDGVIDESVMEEMIYRNIIFVPTLSLAYLIVKGLNEKWIYQSWYKPFVNKAVKINMKSFTDAYYNTMPNEPIKDFFINIPKSEIEKVPKIQFESVKRYISMGGKVAMGTDSALGFSLHDTPVSEISLLQSAGLTLEQTIMASTKNSAKVFGKEYELGTIEAKKRADIVIIDANLKDDIKKIERIKTVIIDGKIVV